MVHASPSEPDDVYKTVALPPLLYTVPKFDEVARLAQKPPDVLNVLMSKDMFGHELRSSLPQLGGSGAKGWRRESAFYFRLLGLGSNQTLVFIIAFGLLRHVLGFPQRFTNSQ
jgi:hypothetical protein